MVAKILIAAELSTRQKEINQLLSLHLLGATKNHPDLLYFSAGSKLGINEAKKIKEHFAFKPTQAGGKVAVLEDASTLTQVAQNTLLKTLEELPENGLVILGADSPSYFLPTILSRCQIVRIQQVSESADQHKDFKDDITKLLNSSLEERFKYVEKLEEKEKFLDGLIFHFRDQLVTSPTPAVTEFLNTLLQAKKWLKQNVNQRAILEYLMLKLP